MNRPFYRIALTALAPLVLAAGYCPADTVLLDNGRIIVNCEVLTEEDAGDETLRQRWREMIADPEWTVIRTEDGLWGFKNTSIEKIEIGTYTPIPTPEPERTLAVGGIDVELSPEDPNATETPDIGIIETPLIVQQLRGRAYNVAVDERTLVDAGAELNNGDTVRVTWNSRLRGTMGERISIGAVEGTNFAINELYRTVRIGTEFYLDLTLTQGRLWIEISPRLSKIDSVRFKINGNQLYTTRPMLMSLQVTDTGILQASVFESKDFNIRFVIPGVEQAVPLTEGRRVDVTPERATLGTELDDVPLTSAERQAWSNWNSWRPDQLVAEEISLRPDITGQGIQPYKMALPEDDPGRNQRSIRSVRFRATFFALRSYRNGLRRYLNDTGVYPPQDPGWSVALRGNPGVSGWNGPYVEGDLPLRDVWDRPFIYETWRDAGNQLRADIRSTGPNGIDEFGFGDDLR